MASKEQVDQYHEQGYFITDHAVESQMLEELTAAAQRTVSKVHAGEVVDDHEGVHMGGPGTDPEFIIGLIAPEFEEPAFAAYLGTEAIARYLEPFLGAQLRLGWVHLCAVQGAYQGNWHRDIGHNERDASYEVEMEILAHYRKDLLKWHLALADDPCLWIVPGSQRRYRTDPEREVLINDGLGEMPGAIPIELKRGQTIFWNGNTIHRGWKPERMGARLTLMGALINHDSAYNVSEKGDQPWLLADNIRPSLPARARGYYDNWRSLAAPRMNGSKTE